MKLFNIRSLIIEMKEINYIFEQEDKKLEFLVMNRNTFSSLIYVYDFDYYIKEKFNVQIIVKNFIKDGYILYGLSSGETVYPKENLLVEVEKEVGKK